VFSKVQTLILFSGNGKIGHSNQGNNMYLFPGLDHYHCTPCQLVLFLQKLSFHFFLWCASLLCRIGLGTLLSGARIISDGMLQAAAER
jgi:malate dehydrogenase (decarboxylating)